MGLRRTSRFGFPPPTPPASQHTVRQVPLTQGVTDLPWPLRPPGSAASMTNFLPLAGKLVPRSALSSINTIRSMLTIIGMTPRFEADGGATSLWVSDRTRHGLMNSNGSISVASFVSAFGLGVANIATANFFWQYAQVYMGSVDDNVLVAAPGLGSYGTLTVTWQTSGQPLYSYLTGAPRARCVTAFDSYLVAWNTEEAGSGTDFPTRVQWCQRGDPSAWTQEGSGFEDLLDMRGDGSKIIGADNRLILFSNQEIWYGVTAAYPAQFQFYPLDRSVGCSAPMTVQETDLGTIFVGNDLSLRLLPRGGGPSQIIASHLREAIRSIHQNEQGISLSLSWAVFDPVLRLYYLYVDPTIGGTLRGLVLNVDTGEWGWIHHPSPVPRIGCSFLAPDNSTTAKLYFGNSAGTVFSQNSKNTVENGSVLQAAWESGPLATELPGNWKQLTSVNLDYRATSNSTVTLFVSTDGGNTYESTGRPVSLTSAYWGGRAESQVYQGGAFPSLRLTSASTGYELHRLDTSMNLGGRR